MRQASESASGYRGRNSTADRALAILDMFATDRTVVTAQQVADELGVARSTSYRYLQSLVQARYLVDAPGGFGLGLRILELARLARRGFELGTLALPIMSELAQEFRETVLLTRLIGDTVVCIERHEPEGQRVRLSYEVGSTMPINAGASAMCLLAWLPAAEVKELLGLRPLRAFTPNTLTDPDRIMLRLEEARKQGFTVSVAELDPEVVGIAAPILDSEGRVRASISVAGLASRLTPDRHDELARSLVRRAGEISTRLSLVD